MTNTAFPDLGGKQRTKAVPPVPHGLMADVDSALEQKIFDLSQRQRVADIQHHSAADDLRRAIEITEGIVHQWRLRELTSGLKPIYSDNARQRGLRLAQDPVPERPQLGPLPRGGGGDQAAALRRLGIVRLKSYVRIFPLLSHLRRPCLSGLSQTKHVFTS